MARHCIHPSRVRSGLLMTRTTPVGPLSHSVGSRVKPLFVAWTISMDSIVPAMFATGASRFWFVCLFSVAGLSYEILARREKCPTVGQSGHGHSRSQDSHFPNHCQCFDAKTVTPTLVSTSAIREFLWIQRGVDLCCSRHTIQKFWKFNGCSRTASRSWLERGLRLCCHIINNF